MIKIPYQRLDPDTLRALIEEFVTRDGTDYGDHECSVDTKVNQVMGQLRAGEVGIVFDAHHQSCQLVHKNHLAEIEKAVDEDPSRPTFGQAMRRLD